MVTNDDPSALVYQALDQVLADGTVRPGTPMAIYRAVDEMRATFTPKAIVLKAEAVAIEIHKLGCALQRSDPHEADCARRELKKLAAEWLDMRIRC